MTNKALFDPGCARCARLAGFLREVRSQHPGYWARPVPSFGAADPRILIVGLAPGLHGANRTGRPFTGDYAGILLYQTLYDAGLATRAHSESRDDALRLRHARIINSVKCVPPQNKPTPAEIRTCNAYLRAELEGLGRVKVVLALGRIAHEAFLRASALKPSAFPFAHGREHPLQDGRTLIDSYHCSRYNTSTRRLTPQMFASVVARACALAGV